MEPSLRKKGKALGKLIFPRVVPKNTESQAAPLCSASPDVLFFSRRYKERRTGATDTLCSFIPLYLSSLSMLLNSHREARSSSLNNYLLDAERVERGSVTGLPCFQCRPALVGLGFSLLSLGACSVLVVFLPQQGLCKGDLKCRMRC